MKRKITAIALVAVGIAIAVCGSFAYFTAADTAHNVITSGGVDIEIIEKTRTDGGAEVCFPEEGMKNIMPGSKVSKIVSVANTGAGDAWIRVKVESKIIGADRRELPVVIDGTPVMRFDIGSGWVDGGDGYYYCKTPVSAGGKTAELFREVLFAAKMGNEYQRCTAHLTVSAEAVQAANNEIPAGGDVTDLVGWPSA